MSEMNAARANGTRPNVPGTATRKTGDRTPAAGRATDAATGAQVLRGREVSQARIAGQLQMLSATLQQLSLVVAQQGFPPPGASGGGDIAPPCGCASAPAPKRKGKPGKGPGSPEQVLQRKPAAATGASHGHEHGRSDRTNVQQKAPKGASGAPDKVQGEESHNGLVSRSRRVLDAAHASGLKLVSGHRPGDPGGHGNGSAVDVGNVKLGTRQGSREMKAFAEQMRRAGKSGDPNVGYVIYDQKIASARAGWAWRRMEDRGSNTQNHFDHVHVSTDPKR